MIYQELLHLFSTFKNGFLQKLEKWRASTLDWTDSMAEGLIYMTVSRLARVFTLHYHHSRTNFCKFLNQTSCFHTKNNALNDFLLTLYSHFFSVIVLSIFICLVQCTHILSLISLSVYNSIFSCSMHVLVIIVLLN